VRFFLIKKSNLFLILFLLFCPLVKAAATLHHTKIWNDINLSGAIFPTSKILYELTNQTRSNVSPDKLETYIVMGGLGYQYLPNLSFWLGGRWNTENYFSHQKEDIWTWQQITWRIINDGCILFLSRSRLEERKRESEPQWNDRFRNLLVLKFNNRIDDRFTPIISNEVFFNVTRPIWVSHHFFSQNRFFVGIDIPTSKNTYLQVGYMNQYILKNTENDMNHIIYAGLYINTGL
jgi:Protein of unknown function (DUF2490)